MENNKKILMLTRYGKKGASSRYRFYDYKPFFEEKGYICDVNPLLDDNYLKQRYGNDFSWRFTLLMCYFKRFLIIYKLRRYDLVFIEKEVFPYLPYWFEFFILFNINYALDYDDAIFHTYDDSENWLVRWFLRNKISKLIKRSRLVVSGNNYLDDYAVKSKALDTIIVNTNVNIGLYKAKTIKKNSQFTIVWIGSPSTASYISIVEEPLKFICKKYSARFIMIGGMYEIEGMDIEYLEWSSETEIEILKSCHVGIMPLYDKGWEKGKCGFKLIQYMASKLPVIASPVGINSDLILNGKNGYLANSTAEWIDALDSIYSSGDEMGKIGFSLVEKKYSILSSAPYLIDSLKNLIQNRRVDSNKNINAKLVSDFGTEWTKFDQSSLSKEELNKIWNDYFSVFPWDKVSKNQSIGADIGCGTGRWAEFVLPNVKKLHLVDPSIAAIGIARKKLQKFNNIEFHEVGVDSLPFEDNSLDFAYSLGVLHHVPDINTAFLDISKKLKKGAPFLIYLYYSMENKPIWFVAIWKVSDYVRKFIIKFPYSIRFISSQVIALIIYFPIVLLGRTLNKMSILPKNWPLYYYIDKSFYIIRNDSLDRFATTLENRYNRSDIEKLFSNNGFVDIKFSDKEPFWCASGIKK